MHADHQAAAFWDRMYADRAKPWDPEPNAVLAEVAAGLAPGLALDVGCGEGADALWLARRGWTVTAFDFSEAALARARAADPDGLVAWRLTDMHEAAPVVGAYDLVTAHYLHVPPAERAAFFGGLGAAVKPGGTLVVVAHHPSDLKTQVGRPDIADLYFTAEDVAPLLGPGPWELVEAGTRPLEVTNHEGRRVTIQDMVLVARRG